MMEPEDRWSAADHPWTCRGCGRTINAIDDNYYVTTRLETYCVSCGKKLDPGRARMTSWNRA